MKKVSIRDPVNAQISVHLRNWLVIVNMLCLCEHIVMLIVFTDVTLLKERPPGGQNQALLHLPPAIFTQIASSNNVVKRRYLKARFSKHLIDDDVYFVQARG